MSDTHAFERSHDILITAPAANVLDYVCNPNSWPEWLAHTRSGPAVLDWLVTECEPPHVWIGETSTDFIGTIIVRYDVAEAEEGQVRFTRTMINPARPKPPTDDQIARMDAEAEVALANIKKIVEARVAKAS
ncbi:hypothetical protein [uncultured Sneathiella sp.]|uniref:hypothetical protein n=1 Tax=uncultured Sneathiella sp. TaxID=879315 RepID=UPI0030D77D15